MECEDVMVLNRLSRVGALKKPREEVVVRDIRDDHSHTAAIRCLVVIWMQ